MHKHNPHNAITTCGHGYKCAIGSTVQIHHGELFWMTHSDHVWSANSLRRCCLQYDLWLALRDVQYFAIAMHNFTIFRILTLGQPNQNVSNIVIKYGLINHLNSQAILPITITKQNTTQPCEHFMRHTLIVNCNRREFANCEILYSVTCVLKTRRRKELLHQQPWYWAQCPGLIKNTTDNPVLNWFHYM